MGILLGRLTGRVSGEAMLWLVSALLSLLILIWALYPRKAVVHSGLGYDDIAGVLRIAAGFAFLVLLWTGSLVLAFFITP
jgi:hypothetical protein